MDTPKSGIQHVSDTALLVAACRALETEDEDSFITDPYAARLAGERGMAMLRAVPGAQYFRFGLGIRTRFLDELILDAVGRGLVNTVLSVGCGLDTRPWRLALPGDLRWIEVDFPEMLDYKEGLLAGETSRCRRERWSADVCDAEQRRSMFERAGKEPTFLVTEGLLMYLPGPVVAAMAVDARNHSSVAQWGMDVTTTQFTAAIGARDAMSTVRHVQATDHLPGERIVEALQQNGWTIGVTRSYVRDVGFAGKRIERLMAGRPRPEPPAGAQHDLSGVVVFTPGEGA